MRSTSASACSSPRRMKSMARSKSAAVRPSSCGAISTSCGPSERRLSCTFCSVRMLIICDVTPVIEPKVSRRDKGVPMLTAMTRWAPMPRATSTGRLLTRPPSPRMRPSTSSGANTPGTDMLLRSAVARSPSASTTAWPLSMSVATARNGVGSWSKCLTWPAARVRRRRCDSSKRLDTAPSGALRPSPPTPTTASRQVIAGLAPRRSTALQHPARGGPPVR